MAKPSPPWVNGPSQVCSLKGGDTTAHRLRHIWIDVIIILKLDIPIGFLIVKKTPKLERPRRTPHTSVVAHARAILEEDPQFVEELSAHLGERQFVKALTILRARANLSQAELATQAKCKQPKISKLESGTDAELSFGDVVSYLKTTGHNARIFLHPGPRKVGR